MNIICILAGGSGNRFGSPVPKQYHLINGRPVIEYVIDAAIKSNADEIIIAANNDNIENLQDKYGVIAIKGGSNRNISIANALRYIRGNYECNKLIIAEAVCPLITCELLNLYFAWLDDYDAVFTASDITTNLARHDGKFADRDEYFLVQSPDAYRFDLLYANFKPDMNYSTPLYFLPKGSRIKYYYGFEDYIKIIYPHDLAVAEALMRERDKHVKFEAHSDDTALALFSKLRKINREDAKKWEKVLDYDVRNLFAKWDIYKFSVNQNSYTGLVLECSSGKFSQTVLKIYPESSHERFHREIFILSRLKHYHQVELLDFDEQRRALLIRRIIPGDYIDFNEDSEKISAMFRDLEANRVSSDDSDLPAIIQQTESDYAAARRYNYYPGMIKFLVDNARKVYSENFSDQRKYILHGNVYYRNALKSSNEIIIINPTGYIDAFEFEYMPFFTYELLLHTDPAEYLNTRKKLLSFFAAFTNTKNFNAAIFIFLVKQLIPSIYEANDNFRRADKYLELIKTLYLDENNDFVLHKYFEEP